AEAAHLAYGRSVGKVRRVFQAEERAGRVRRSAQASPPKMDTESRETVAAIDYAQSQSTDIVHPPPRQQLENRDLPSSAAHCEPTFRGPRKWSKGPAGPSKRHP